MHDTNYSYIGNTVHDCIMYLLCPIKYKLETEFKLELYRYMFMAFMQSQWLLINGYIFLYNTNCLEYAHKILNIFCTYTKYSTNISQFINICK